MMLRATVYVWDAASGILLARTIVQRDVEGDDGSAPAEFRRLVRHEINQDQTWSLGAVQTDFGPIGEPWSRH